MGIITGNFSRPAKFSTIIADADLDIGARAILTTDLSLYQEAAYGWCMKNRAKTAYKGFTGYFIAGTAYVSTPTFTEMVAGTGINIDGLLIKDDKIQEVNGIAGNVWAKKASANVRNSHDAEIHDERVDGSTWLLQKTFTLSWGIRGTLRVTLRAKGENASANNKVIWAKNSKADDLGVEFVPANVNWQTDSQDVNVGTMDAGETIEIYTQTDDWMGIFVDQCRISYDEDLDVIVSDMVNT